MHRERQKHLQRSALTGRLHFQPLQQLHKLWLLFTLRQDLQAIVVVADVLLVNAQHWEEHIEQVA